jgi:hypothetical protein
MSIFDKPPEKKIYRKQAPKDPEKQQERLEKREAWESFKKQMKDNPDLEREFVFKKMGITAKPQDPTEKQRIELKSALMSEAAEMIKNDPELRRQYAESMIGEVLGEKASKRSRRGEEDDYLMQGPGSSIAQTLDDLEGLAELKSKLEALGMGGNGESKKGFFEGITLKDILSVVAMMKGGMGNGNGGQEQPPSENYYVVQINGKPTRVIESQYKKLIAEGRIKPMAEIEGPKTPEKPVEAEKVEGDSEEPEIQPLISSGNKAEKEKKPETVMSETLGVTLPSLDMILEFVDIATIESYIYMEPDEIISMLKTEVDKNSEPAQFVWGILTTTTYEGFMNILNTYKGDERMTKIFTELESEQGKKWVEAIITRVQEINNA